MVQISQDYIMTVYIALGQNCECILLSTPWRTKVNCFWSPFLIRIKSNKHICKDCT